MFPSYAERQSQDDFYKIDRQLLSKISPSKISLPTLDSTNVEKKVNVILIPDFEDLEHRNTQPSSTENQAGKRLRKKSSLDVYMNPNYDTSKIQKGNSIDQSLIHKYLWDRAQSNDITQHSRKYNIAYQNQSKDWDLNSNLSHSQSLFFKNRQNSVHYCSINPRKKQKVRRKSISMNQKLFFQQDTLNRDANIDVWHTHGLRFGSNILKFGIRNKHIVIVVYHKHKAISTIYQNPQDEPGLSKQSIKWSNFIRQVNKKCIIGHLYITDQSLQGTKEGQKLQQRESLIFKDSIRISQIHERQNEYRVDLAIKTKMKENSYRVILIVDRLLEQQISNASLLQGENSYSKIETIIQKRKKPSKDKSKIVIDQFPGNLSQNSGIEKKQPTCKQPQREQQSNDIGLETPKKRPTFGSCGRQQETAASTQKKKSPFFLDVARSRSKQSSMQKRKGLSIISKGMANKKNEFELFKFVKSFCCNQVSTEKSAMDIQLEPAHFYVQQNIKTKSHPIRKNIYFQLSQK